MLQSGANSIHGVHQTKKKMRKLIFNKEIKISPETTGSEIRLSRELIRAGYSKNTLAIQEKKKTNGLFLLEGNQNLLVPDSKQLGDLFWLIKHLQSWEVSGTTSPLPGSQESEKDARALVLLMQPPLTSTGYTDYRLRKKLNRSLT